MARFGDPQHHGHMLRGVAAAAKSPNTPAHLRPHLEARMRKNNYMTRPPLAKGNSAMKPRNMGTNDMDGDEMQPAMQPVPRAKGMPKKVKVKKAGKLRIVGKGPAPARTNGSELGDLDSGFEPMPPQGRPNPLYGE